MFVKYNMYIYIQTVRGKFMVAWPHPVCSNGDFLAQALYQTGVYNNVMCILTQYEID